jgi:hypothetical protein
MKIFSAARELARLFKLAIEIAQLPSAHLRFRLHINPVEILAAYKYYTKPHPRFRFFKNKSIGIALLDLRDFATPLEYLESVKKKDYAAYHGKRAKVRGYAMREIDRNAFIDEIYQINTSQAIRQGRPMADNYVRKKTSYQHRDNFKCFGAFNSEGRLVAYCNIAIFGNFAATDQLLGYKNADGVMYLLLAEIVCVLIEDRSLEYFMYDSYLGARPGMRNFKKRVGFKPYCVRYSMNKQS